MSINSYFENLVFASGSKIKVSRTVDPDFLNRVHWHPYVEVLVSLCDGNKVTVDYNEFELKTNDLVVVYPGNLHALNFVSEDMFLVIQFPIELLSCMSEMQSTLRILSERPCIRYTPCSKLSSEIIFLLTDIANHSNEQEPFKEMHMYSQLLELFIRIGTLLLAEHNLDPGGANDSSYKNTRLMTEACLFIAENCTEQLTLDTVTRKIGLSKSHFAHLFKSYTNMTFVDFLTMERIKRAETLLSDEQKHIIDIAFDSGFSSASSFNRAFRKAKGCSPSDFRLSVVN